MLRQAKCFEYRPLLRRDFLLSATGYRLVLEATQLVVLKIMILQAVKEVVDQKMVIMVQLHFQAPDHPAAAVVARMHLEMVELQVMEENLM